MPKTKDPRLSYQALCILRLFIDKPKNRLAGSDISKQTGIMSGTIYPVLARLERAKWLESDWETLEPTDVGRPRKRLYRLTGIGCQKATEAMAKLGFGIESGRLIWGS